MTTEPSAQVAGALLATDQLSVGDRVRLKWGESERLWWTVQAVTDNFVACVQQMPFRKAGTLRYTVLDWRNARRGPCNLIGQGWGDGTYSHDQCAEMLAEFEADDIEVSHRNNVPLGILDWQPARRELPSPSTGSGHG